MVYTGYSSLPHQPLHVLTAESASLTGIGKLELELSNEPSPEDYRAESETVERLVDAALSPDFRPYASTLDKYGTITSWVAWQLGCMAEGAVEDGDIDRALRIGSVAVQAAVEARSVERLSANLLTMAGIAFRQNDLTQAVSTYHQILALPPIGGFQERAGAHISLGGIFAMQGRTAESVYHYETGLRSLRGTIDDDIYDSILRGLVGLYSQIEDLGGLVHCGKRLEGQNVDELLRSSEISEWSLERAMLLATRLHSFAEHELAELTLELWRERNSIDSDPSEGEERS